MNYKPFVVVDTFDEFKDLKVPVDDTNTIYITYDDPLQVYGTPDVLWKQIVFVLDKGIIYTKGKLFTNFEDIINRLSELESSTALIFTDFDTRLSSFENQTYATQSYVNTQINNIVNNAPEAFDTLKEIADAIDNNQSVSGGIIQQIAAIKSGLGTASSKNVPTSGNATSTQVVMGNDNRLTNERTPTDHASNKVTSMEGYAKPNSTSAISTSDTLNQAIGKLEKGLEILGESSKTVLVSGTVASIVNIEPYKVYEFGTLSINMTITFDTTKEVSGYCAQYMFRFTAGASCGITLPNTVKYSGGNNNQTFVEGRVYEINITDNLCVIGEFY